MSNMVLTITPAFQAEETRVEAERQISQKHKRLYCKSKIEFHLCIIGHCPTIQMHPSYMTIL